MRAMKTLLISFWAGSVFAHRISSRVAIIDQHGTAAHNPKVSPKNSGQQLMSNRSEHKDLAKARNTALVQIVEPEQHVSMAPYKNVLTQFLAKKGRGSPCVIQSSLHQTSTNKVTPEVMAIIEKYGVLELSHKEGDKAYYRIKAYPKTTYEKLGPEADRDLIKHQLVIQHGGYIVNTGFAVPKVTTVQEAMDDEQMQPFVGISPKPNAVGVFLNVALAEGARETDTELSGILCAFKSSEEEFENQGWEWYSTQLGKDGVPHKKAATQGNRYQDAALYAAAVGLTPVENRKYPYYPDDMPMEKREQKDKVMREKLLERARKVGEVGEVDLMNSEVFVRSHESFTGATAETEGTCSDMFEALGM